MSDKNVHNDLNQFHKQHSSTIKVSYSSVKRYFWSEPGTEHVYPSVLILVSNGWAHATFNLLCLIC